MNPHRRERAFGLTLFLISRWVAMLLRGVCNMYILMSDPKLVIETYITLTWLMCFDFSVGFVAVQSNDPLGL
jgi:hypothetical protein